MSSTFAYIIINKQNRTMYIKKGMHIFRRLNLRKQTQKDTQKNKQCENLFTNWSNNNNCDYSVNKPNV